MDCPDVINLADVCVDARQAAQLAFKRKFGSQEFTLQIDENIVKLTFWSGKRRLRRRFDEKRIRSDVCFKFLRIFGSVISELEIELSSKTIKNVNRCQKIIEYVNKFSGESQKKVILRDYFSYLLEQPMQNMGEIEIYKAEHTLHFKAKWNGTKIDLEINDKREILFQLIRPEQFERMSLIYGPFLHGLDWFFRRFENLKHLTMILHESSMDKFVNNTPQVQILQICVGHSEIRFLRKQFDPILSSAAAQSNLSILSYHFQDTVSRGNFSYTPMGPWTISQNDDGPDGYRHSLVLNRIPSV